MYVSMGAVHVYDELLGCGVGALELKGFVSDCAQSAGDG